MNSGGFILLPGLATSSSDNSYLSELSPEALNTVYPGKSAAAGSTGAAPSSGMSASQGLMGGMAAMAVIQTIGGIIISGIQRGIQKTQMKAQYDSAVSRSKHTDEMAKTGRDSQLAQLESQRNQQEIAAAGNKNLNKATENRKEAEDGLIIAKATIKEEERTEESWRRSSRALDNYFYGTPV